MNKKFCHCNVYRAASYIYVSAVVCVLSAGQLSDTQYTHHS